MPGGVNILGSNSQLNAPDNPLYVQNVGDGPGGAEKVAITGTGGDVTTSNGSIHTIEQGNATLLDGTLSATTTAAALGASQVITRVLVQNDPASTVNIMVGNATTQSIKLVPGASIEIEIDDLSKVYVKSATGTTTVNYLAGA